MPGISRKGAHAVWLGDTLCIISARNYSRLGESIDTLREFGLPIAVIGSASLLWYADVRAALRRADWVSVKIDSVDPRIWERMNRPHGVLLSSCVLSGRWLTNGSRGSC
jgi:hypothetical protein